MITIYFDCPLCGLKDHALQVPARESADIDVRTWMDSVIWHCAEEHRRVSPKCNPRELKNLKVPLPKEGEFLGQQIE